MGSPPSTTGPMLFDRRTWNSHWLPPPDTTQSLLFNKHNHNSQKWLFLKKTQQKWQQQEFLEVSQLQPHSSKQRQNAEPLHNFHFVAIKQTFWKLSGSSVCFGAWEYVALRSVCGGGIQLHILAALIKNNASHDASSTRTSHEMDNIRISQGSLSVYNADRIRPRSPPWQADHLWKSFKMKKRIQKRYEVEQNHFDGV